MPVRASSEAIQTQNKQNWSCLGHTSKTESMQVQQHFHIVQGPVAGSDNMKIRINASRAGCQEDL